jgi:PhnB protein
VADEQNERELAAIAAMLDGCPTAGFKARLRRSLERSTSMATRVAARAPGVRAGFTALTPYLVVPDVESLIAFVKHVFGAEETHRAIGSAGGTHCEVRIGDSMLMIGEGLPDVAYGGRLRSRCVGLHVYVDDADAVYQRAIEAGAESLGAPADRPYGERAGFVKDSAGNHWYIATRLGPTYFARTPRSVTPHVYVQRSAGRGAPELIDFLGAAFGARVELRHDTPDGVVLHAVLRIRDAAIEVGEGHGAGLSAPACLYLYVDDCDAVYGQAIEAGATSLHAPVDRPQGDRLGGVADAWGNEWFIATHLGAR